MSLINDMLSDLDQRKKERKNSAEFNPMAGLSPPDDAKQKKQPTDSILQRLKKSGFFSVSDRKKAIRLLLIFVSIVLLMLVLLTLYRISTAKSVKLNKTNSVQTINLEESATVVQQSKEKMKPNVAPQERIVEQIKIEAKDQHLSLRFALSAPIHYHIDFSHDHKEMTLMMRDVKTAQQLPSLQPFSHFIQSAGLTAVNHDLELKFHLADLAHVKSVQLNKKPAYLEIILKQTDEDLGQEQAEILNKHTESKIRAHDVVIKKTPVKPILLEDKIRGEYTQAVRLSAAQEPKKARELLSQILKEQPDFLPARKAIVVLLMQQLQYADAAKYLDQGLMLSPQELSLIKLKARLLASQNQTGKAIQLLRANAPAIDKDPEYFSIIAALEERIGDHVIAGQLYRELLHVDSSRAEWWVGLGIAMEKQGQLNDAAEAYREALTLSGMDANLQLFVQRRLNALSGL